MTVSDTGPQQDFQAAEVQACPFGYYDRARAESPVHRFPGTELYLLTRHRDVVEAFKRPGTFSSHRPPLGAGDPEIAQILATGWPTTPTLTTADPPEHTAYRKLIKRHFTTSAIAARERSLRETVDEIIDGFAAAGEVEFVAQFAQALPGRIVGDFLGQPRELAPKIKQWSYEISSAVDPAVPRERAVQCARGAVEFQRHFVADIERKRAEPGEDFLSFLATTELDGRPLPLEVLLDYVRVFVTGGNDTVSSLLSSALYLLLIHPDQFAEVLADRSLIPAAVEETMRFESPGHWFTRMLQNGDAVVDGVRIPQGSRVLLGAGAANRDPAVFPEPARFDIHRDAAHHLGFGHGIHFCLGAPLARLEARIAFEQLFDRLADIRLAVPAEQIRFAPRTITRQLERLPLAFRAVR